MGSYRGPAELLDSEKNVLQEVEVVLESRNDAFSDLREWSGEILQAPITEADWDNVAAIRLPSGKVGSAFVMGQDIDPSGRSGTLRGSGPTPF